MQDPRITKSPTPTKSRIKGEVGWKSPSNIAIVKYWGKYGNQRPKNPSVSFTLDAAVTQTIVGFAPKKGDKGQILFLFDGREKPSFQQRIETYFGKVAHLFPFVSDYDLEIRSENSFPHSAGIASSASAMSALALCLCSMEQALNDSPMDQSQFLHKASVAARLGSGSACRSVFGMGALWGRVASVPSSTDDAAISIADDIDPVFQNMHDDIVIVSDVEKAVSSSQGHALMENNPFAEQRFAVARKHTEQLLDILRAGDVDAFGAILEHEAMQLHALMMCSKPPYMLFTEESVRLMQAIWSYRAETKLPVYFTLDAGPNVHVMYPHAIEREIHAFLQDHIATSQTTMRILRDRVGNGPEKIQNA